MVAFLVCCVALAISAMYELIEWWAALAMGQGADDFLGTQGDQWDTQSDMFCALLGAFSGARCGATAENAPTTTPIEPKLAKPHNAKEIIATVLASRVPPVCRYGEKLR